MAAADKCVCPCIDDADFTRRSFNFKRSGILFRFDNVVKRHITIAINRYKRVLALFIFLRILPSLSALTIRFRHQAKLQPTCLFLFQTFGILKKFKMRNANVGNNGNVRLGNGQQIIHVTRFIKHPFLKSKFPETRPNNMSDIALPKTCSHRIGLRPGLSRRLWQTAGRTRC